MSESHEIRTLHDPLTALLPRGSKIAFLDYPTYNNTGDLLIYLGTIAFFRSAGWAVTFAANPNNFTTRNFLSTSFDAVVMQGGGNFGDLYPEHQALRERVASLLPSTRQIILPQSIYFQSAERMKESFEKLSAATDSHLFVRDRVSFEVASKNFKGSVILAPDMAHHLRGWLSELRTAPSIADNHLYFMREDTERGILDEEITSMSSQFTDWRQMNTTFLRSINKAFRLVEAAEKATATNFGLEKAYRRLCLKAVYDVARKVCAYDRIWTSRLHMMILGSLLDRDIRFIDNSYGKLSSYYEAWGQYMPTVARYTRDTPNARKSNPTS